MHAFMVLRLNLGTWVGGLVAHFQMADRCCSDGQSQSQPRCCRCSLTCVFSQGPMKLSLLYLIVSVMGAASATGPWDIVGTAGNPCIAEEVQRG
jgi:hypothetical protein